MILGLRCDDCELLLYKFYEIILFMKNEIDMNTVLYKNSPVILLMLD